MNLHNFCTFETMGIKDVCPKNDTLETNKLLFMNVKKNIIEKIEKQVEVQESFTYHIPNEVSDNYYIDQFMSFIKLELFNRNITSYHFCCSNKGVMVNL